MKKQYIKPTLKCAEFEVEAGFAASGIHAMSGDRSLFRDFDFDYSQRGSFTRSSDNANDIWGQDGSNGGYWD